MYLGQVVELAPTDRLVNNPLHPYTNALLSAVLLPESRWEHRRERIVLRGDLPSPRNPPSACRFHTRCPIGPRYYPERTICEEVEPPLAEHAPGQFAACHFAGELTDSATRSRSRHPQSSARALTSVADPTSPVDEKRRRSE
jgi:peptide/nickel transport system ATP-binding protein